MSKFTENSGDPTSDWEIILRMDTSTEYENFGENEAWNRRGEIYNEREARCVQVYKDIWCYLAGKFSIFRLYFINFNAFYCMKIRRKFVYKMTKIDLHVKSETKYTLSRCFGTCRMSFCNINFAQKVSHVNYRDSPR